MDEIWTCPSCGNVGLPITRNRRSLRTKLLPLMLKIVPKRFVYLAWRFNREGHIICVNCKINRLVPQNSPLGRLISANHGLKIPAELTRSQRTYKGVD